MRLSVLLRSFHKDYYSTSYPEILGITRNASEKDVKSAYFHLVKTYHPDVNQEQSAKGRFAEIVE